MNSVNQYKNTTTKLNVYILEVHFLLHSKWLILRNNKVASNFVLILKKPATKTYQMFKEVFDDNSLCQSKTFLVQTVQE